MKIWICLATNSTEMQAFTTRWLADAWRELQREPHRWLIKEGNLLDRIEASPIQASAPGRGVMEGT